MNKIHIIYGIIIVILIIVALWVDYAIATSNLPLWVKFFLLK